MTAAATTEAAVKVDRVGGRDRRLDGLRALAAIAVILTHVGDWTDSLTGPHASWIQELNVGVTVFFVISAVLLYAPFVATHLDGRPHPDLRTYATRRILRIYPAYWVALAVIVPLSPIFGLQGRWQWIANPLLVHTYSTAGLSPGAGLRQAWTLVIEVSFYAFLPVYAWCVRGLGRRIGALKSEVSCAIGLLIAGPIFLHLSARNSVVQLPYLLRVLPPALGIFGAGMLIVIAREAVGRRPESPRWWRIIGRSAVPWFIVAFAAYWVICERLGIVATLPLLTPHQLFMQHLFQTIVAFCVVAPAVIVPVDRSWTLRAIGSRPLAFVGMVSYGIYLWHYAVIEWLVRRVGCDPTSLRPCPPTVHWSFVKVSLAAVPLSIAAGALSWYLIERPMIRLTHRSTRRAASSA